MTDLTLKDHQYSFTAYIRDPENVKAPDGIEQRRMNIYRELFYNNIQGFISNGFPVIRSIYSDENWHKMVRDFYANHRCKTPYFLEISEEFLAYLQNERITQPEDPIGLLELAHYEWVELALHVSDETINMNTIEPNGDLLDGHPVLSALAWPLSYQFPVHKMCSEYLPETTPEQPTYLVVYRNRNDEVKFMELNPVTARLINLLQDNETLSGRTAIEQIAQEMNHPNLDAVLKGGLDALQELQSHGIILGISN